MAFLVDSYAWLEYFGGNEGYAKYIESEEPPFTAASSLTEIVRAFARKKIPTKKVGELVSFVTERSVILPLGKDDAIKAGLLAEEFSLHFSDALIYAFASNGRRLVTGDAHFKGLPFVEFVQA